MTAVLPLPAASVLGETTTVAPAGRPLTPMVTGFERLPLAGVSDSAKLALPPGITVCAVPPLMVKSIEAVVTLTATRHHSSKRLVDFVRDGCSQFANNGDAGNPG